MFNKVIYTIVIATFIFLTIGLLLPSNVNVERSVLINRPASTVFVLLNSFRTFRAWSPLAVRDPDAEYVFSGPSAGVGARMDWQGDPRQVGNGWQEIIESAPFERISMQLDFENQGRAVSYFNIDDRQTAALLTWGFEANLVEGQGFFGGLLARYFGLFFDQWIGTDYEQGLANLKAYAESLPATDFSSLDAEILHVEPVDILYIQTGNQAVGDDVGASLAAAYQEISAFMQENSIKMLSQPMAITRSWDALTFQFDAAIPVVSADVPMSGNVRAGLSPSGAAVRVVHKGPYEQMGSSYEQLTAFMAVNGLQEGRVSWEHYISNPGQTVPSELVTHIYFLIGEESTGKPE
jgi:effector-binding domain-containing protein